jgi:hypothetical protein
VSDEFVCVEYCERGASLRAANGEEVVWLSVNEGYTRQQIDRILAIANRAAEMAQADKDEEYESKSEDATTAAEEARDAAEEANQKAAATMAEVKSKFRAIAMQFEELAVAIGAGVDVLEEAEEEAAEMRA